MRKTSMYFMMLFACLSCITAKAFNNIWQKVDAGHVASKEGPLMHPVNYTVYSLNTQYVKDMLFSLSSDPLQAGVIELPLPDGNFRSFRVWQNTMIPAELGNKYPNIKTFTATAVDNQRITAKLDFTEFGFHAMVFDGENTSFIDPYNNLNDGFYMCHYKKDEYRPLTERMVCQFRNDGDDEIAPPAMQTEGTHLPKLAAKIATGYQLHTYRLALACSHQYAAAAVGNPTPTKAQTLSKMTTSLNRVNGVYETEFAITMNFVSNEDTLIYIVAAGDPYSADNANPNNLLDDNQTMCDSLVGTPNYDFGHVFTTAGGGLSQLGCICDALHKAESETGGSNPVGDGFDIDYVAHEMGHAYGANHTFNNGTNGSCGGGNEHHATAYEPGSGTTIMAYAGICSPDDIQPHSDAYFHAASLKEIYNYSIVGTGNTCAVNTATNNKPVGIASFTAIYNIPYKTPFELIAPVAVDSVADTLTTYCWEQWNLGATGTGGDNGKALNNTYKTGPIFRSFDPAVSTIRVFPRIDSVLKGTLTYVATENKKGEKAPDTARFLTFKLTVRDVFQGYGCFLFPDDTIHLNASSTGAANSYQGFTVTSPSTAVNWTGGSTQTITWNVVGTDTLPVNCDSVNIYLSTDGGYTWPNTIGRFANNGTANVIIPNVATTSTARIKVKGNNNVFFNVNGSNFTVTHLATGVAQLNMDNDVKVYPNPSDGLLHVLAGNNDNMQAIIYNTIGQAVWSGQFAQHADISLAGLAKGIYYLQIKDNNSGARTVKSVVIK